MTDATPPVLELRGVDAGYRQFRALFDVSVEVSAGRAVALVGSNGAGKTTLARVASGLVAPTSGSVLIDGVDVTGAPAHSIATMGVVHAPEGRATFGSLTVEENLVLPFHRQFGRGGVGAALDRAYELFPRLGHRRRQMAGSLSGGEQRMLTLARVLVSEPRLLIADELSLGLAPIITSEVYLVLERIHDAGTALLVVEQHLDQALAIADEVVVLDRGRVVFRGAPDEMPDGAGASLSPVPVAAEDRP